MASAWHRFFGSTILLLALLALFGCGGGGGVSGVQQSSYTLSGQVTVNGVGLAGVSVAIVGQAGALTTDANGRFSASLSNGSYTVTPTLAGYTFYPASQTMTVAGGSISVPDFTASAVATSHTVSGRVLGAGGAALAGVSVVLSGAGTGSATTDGNGAYSFSGVPSGSSTVTPSLAGYSFTPLSQVVTVGASDLSVPDFTASALVPATYTVSGRVTLNGSGLAGVTVTITGAGSGSLTTGADGTFAFVGVRNGSYTLIPAIAGYSFTPSSLSVTVNNGSLAGQNFSAVPPTGGSITITF